MGESYFSEVCERCGRRFPPSTIVAHVARHLEDDAAGRSVIQAEGKPNSPIDDIRRTSARERYEFGRRFSRTDVGFRGGRIDDAVRRFMVTSGLEALPPKAKRATLAERVADDLDALTADVAIGPAPTERGKPAPDLTAYHDAYAEAVRSCPHEAPVGTIFGREWQCLDCGTYLDLDAMRRRFPNGFMFG